MRLRSLLFSFEGRINRAKYWYVSFAGLCSYLVFFVFMAALAWALGGIFRATSVHVQIFPLFSYWARFSYDSPASNAALIYPLFSRPRFHSSSSACGSWRPPRSRGFTIATKAAGGLSHYALLQACSTGSCAARQPPDCGTYRQRPRFRFGPLGLCELFCLRGMGGPNRFGPDPLAAPNPSIHTISHTPA